MSHVRRWTSERRTSTACRAVEVVGSHRSHVRRSELLRVRHASAREFRSSQCDEHHRRPEELRSQVVREFERRRLHLTPNSFALPGPSNFRIPSNPPRHVGKRRMRCGIITTHGAGAEGRDSSRSRFRTPRPPARYTRMTELRRYLSGARGAEVSYKARRTYQANGVERLALTHSRHRAPMTQRQHYPATLASEIRFIRPIVAC